MACSQAAPFQPLKRAETLQGNSPKNPAVVQALRWIMLRDYYVAKTNTMHKYKQSSSTLPLHLHCFFPRKWEIFFMTPCFFCKGGTDICLAKWIFTNLDFPEILEDFPNPKSYLFSPKKTCVRSRWNLTRWILPYSKIRTKQVEPRKISSYQAKPRKEVPLKTIVGKLGF